MAGFFPHMNGNPTEFVALPETTYSGVLDSIVADVGVGINGWTLYDDMRVSGVNFPIAAYGNVGGVDSVTAVAWGAFSSGSALPLTASYWSPSAGNSIGADQYPGRTQISVDKVNWYTIADRARYIGGRWTFSLDRPYAQSTVSGVPYFVKMTKYIVLKCTSLKKSFYVLLARPDSACDILRVQIFEDWDNVNHVGTNGSNMEIMRGTGYPDIAYWDNNWDNQPVKYMLWLLPDVFGLWASFGTAPVGVDVNVYADFCYAGNLDTTGIRDSDPGALVWGCTHMRLSGFGVLYGQLWNQAMTANSMNGNVGGLRCLRTLQGEYWSMPLPGTGSRPNGWNVSNQYALSPRAMTYHHRVDSGLLDLGGRVQFTEFDVYQTGMSAGTMMFNEGKRGMMRYVKCPVNNPSGCHLVTLGPAEDGNTYIIFRVSPPFRYAMYNSLASGDIEDVSKVSSFAYSAKYTGSSANLGEIYIPSPSDVILFRWFMMPINL